jgi:Na+/H+ antiporter NhaD/arsenite permease-like protein
MSPLPLLATASVSAVGVAPWLIAPFGLLLLLIAAMPLTPHRIKQVWEKYYPHIALGLGLFIAGWYVFKMPHGTLLVRHTVLEYISFIALIGSLFVVAGGIHLRVKGSATPWENLRLLAIGAVVANLVGTTGASMVLIRPWLRMNRGRIRPYHVVFFIFIISNCGGALTPIGDPPLFLGYLRGVPFFWLTCNVAGMWAAVVGSLLAVFWWLDRREFRKQSEAMQEKLQEADSFRLDGKFNLVLLGLVIAAVFIPGRIPLLREAVMIAVAAISHRFTSKAVHESNAFSFGPIKEVAFLFSGIFLTMMPALGYIAERGSELGVERPMQYYLAAGTLSSALDNAPTYATFFELALAAAGTTSTGVLLETTPRLVIALSLGAVFFGAMTYIGNGPNFMVKSIADGMGVATPSFFGYIFKYSLPILLPILILAGWCFL